MLPPPVPIFDDVEMVDPAIPSVALRIALIDWQAGVVRCGTTSVEARTPVEPRATPDWSEMAPLALRTAPQPIAIMFRIDASGRPLGIKREAIETVAANVNFTDSGDLEPAIAVTRFLVTTAYPSCKLVFTPQRTPLAQASPRLIISAMQSVLGQPNMRALSAALAPPGATCSRRRVTPRVAYFPPLDTLPMLPGRERLVSLTFDIGADGTPINVRTLYASDGATQAAGEEAVGKSRFAPAARTGCVVGFSAPSATLAPPPKPELKVVGGRPTNCPPTKSSKLTVGNVPFPEAFRRRNVEGWALIAYDVAPWGAVGNASVVMAEPAAAFGEQAKRVVMAAKALPSATGYTGCIAPVRFEIGDEREPSNFIRNND